MAPGGGFALSFQRRMWYNQISIGIRAFCRLELAGRAATGGTWSPGFCAAKARQRGCRHRPERGRERTPQGAAFRVGGARLQGAPPGERETGEERTRA